MPQPSVRIDSPQALMELTHVFHKSRIVLTAMELDIFTTLGVGSLGSSELAQKLATDPRATNRLLNALVVLGLVEKHGDAFCNSQLAATHLVRGRPGFVGNFGHASTLWNTWSTLTEAVRQGRSVLPPLEERAPAWFAEFIAAMHFRALQSAPAVVSLIPLEGVSRVLDVGGGSGAFSMAFVKASGEIEATVFDLPPVVALAKGYVKDAGLEGRISFQEGNFHTDDLGGGYDLVFLSAIIHCTSPEKNRRLFRRCAAALNRGGRIVISDFIMDRTRTEPPMGALFALNMLVGTEDGDTFTEEEISGWLGSEGFADVRRVGTGDAADLMVATKR